jgi:hypothetical protein
MSNSYDDAKYGIVERQWFGLPITHGGQGSVVTFNETAATKIKRWYPRGPIQIQKIGVKTLATLGKGEEDFVFKFDTTRQFVITASTTSAPYTVASRTVNDSLSAGSYLSCLASTNVCSTGSVAIFVDFRRKFGTRHDATS